MKVLKDIKVVFKIILIILIVGGVIAGTAYLFFKYLKKEEDSYNALSSYIYSSERADFVAKILDVQKTQNDTQRFDEVLQVNNTLNDIAANLVPSMRNVSVNNKKVMQKYRAVLSRESSCEQAISTFNSNWSDPVFRLNADEGANDIILHLNNYLKEYAMLLNYVNGQISSNVQTTNVDVALYINDVYLQVVENSITNCTTTNGIYNYVDLSNLKVFNNFVDANGFKNYYVNTDIVSNYFIENYNQSNKETFAQTLHEQVTEPDQTTHEGKAATYLAKLIGTEVKNEV